MIDIHTLNNTLLTELKNIAKDLGVPRFQKLKKQELVYEILDFQAKKLSTQKKSDDVKPSRENKQKENSKSKFSGNHNKKQDNRIVRQYNIHKLILNNQIHRPKINHLQYLLYL